MNGRDLTRAELAAKIDHTFLKPAGAADAVEKLCAEARRCGFASVCVNPCEVAAAAAALAGSAVKVCTVVGFPLGQNTAAVKAFEAEAAIADGARELDFVINQRLLKAAGAGDGAARRTLAAELKACAAVKRGETAARLGFPEIVLKLILECCNLTDAEKRLGCELAVESGFDFVKTSTGFAAGGATVEDVRLLRQAVGGRASVKAAGGIRTLEDALAMLAAGADRLGCSAGVAIIERV